MTQDVASAWRAMRAEADGFAQTEPTMAPFLDKRLRRHETFEDALIFVLKEHLVGCSLASEQVQSLLERALALAPDIGKAAYADIKAIHERDPACTSIISPILHFKGFHALSCQRFAHALWEDGARMAALTLQGRTAQIWGIDIHPAAQIGQGIMLDHADGIVIGETATVGDNVSMLHGSTLGGVGQEPGDRHPKIRKGVLIGAHASVLGNIEVGENARIGAGSVVLRDVPPGRTAVGVPARLLPPAPRASSQTTSPD